jgi:hypothetical protein
MAVGHPEFFELEERVNRIQHRRFQRVVFTGLQSSHFFDSLQVGLPPRPVLRSRLGYQSVLDFRPFLSENRDDIVPVQGMRGGERETLSTFGIRIVTPQSQDVGFCGITHIDITDCVGEPSIRIYETK